MFPLTPVEIGPDKVVGKERIGWDIHLKIRDWAEIAVVEWSLAGMLH